MLPSPGRLEASALVNASASAEAHLPVCTNSVSSTVLSSATRLAAPAAYRRSVRRLCDVLHCSRLLAQAFSGWRAATTAALARRQEQQHALKVRQPAPRAPRFALRAPRAARARSHVQVEELEIALAELHRRVRAHPPPARVALAAAEHIAALASEPPAAPLGHSPPRPLPPRSAPAPRPARGCPARQPSLGPGRLAATRPRLPRVLRRRVSLDGRRPGQPPGARRDAAARPAQVARWRARAGARRI